MIFVLIAVFILFLLTKYPKCKVKTVDTSKKNRTGIYETLKYLSKMVNLKRNFS